MTHTPDLWWLSAILAIVLLSDAALSVRPPKFIRDCLEGVGFPKDWWWTLVVVKVIAGVGLLAGLRYPGFGFAANVGVIAYFVCASVAHYRARYLKQEFWINCLGMLGFSVVVIVLSYSF